MVKIDHIIDYTRLNVDQRELMKRETGGYDFRYVYGNDKLSVKVTGEGTDWWGQQVVKNVSKLYYMQDRLGSTVNMTDGYAWQKCFATYGPWGELSWDLRDDSLTVDGGYRQLHPQGSYTGHEYDVVLGKYYAKNRFYNPTDKRFMSMDPVKGSVTDPLSLVSYLYVKDNPLRWVDPLGLKVSRYEKDSPAYKLANLDWSKFTTYAPDTSGNGKVYQLREIFAALGMDEDKMWDKDTGSSLMEYSQEGYVGKAEIHYNMSKQVPIEEGYRITIGNLKFWYYNNGPIPGSTFWGDLSEPDGRESIIKLTYYKDNAYVDKETLIKYFERVFCIEEQDATLTPNPEPGVKRLQVSQKIIDWLAAQEAHNTILPNGNYKVDDTSAKDNSWTTYFGLLVAQKNSHGEMQGVNGFSTEEATEFLKTGVPKERYDTALHIWLSDAENKINDFAAKHGLQLTQNQFDALFSFMWNYGKDGLFISFDSSDENNFGKGSYSYDFLDVLIQDGFLTNPTDDQIYEFKKYWGNYIRQKEVGRIAGMWARRMDELEIFFDTDLAYQHHYLNLPLDEKTEMAEKWLAERGLPGLGK